jgi:TPP-dependent trihydroxycyclohexane-1,2-dione (THcHDO) dehydratase
VNALRGRSIGLKASMNDAEMEKHLSEIRSNWEAEGHSKQDVINAILAKARPLIIGFYWARFPDSSERLSRVMKKLGYPVDNAAGGKIKVENNQKNSDSLDDSAKSKKKTSPLDLMKQFKSALS